MIVSPPFPIHIALQKLNYLQSDNLKQQVLPISAWFLHAPKQVKCRWTDFAVMIFGKAALIDRFHCPRAAVWPTRLCLEAEAREEVYP